MAFPVAIITADVHLSDKAPNARTGETDWFAAMGRSLKKLRSLAEKYQCPVMYAGDIFDHWNASAALINFALDYLPAGYAIPGQHDLPYHADSYAEKSAYQTLVKVGHLKELSDKPSSFVVKFDSNYDTQYNFYGFGWNKKVKDPIKPPLDWRYVNVALVHRYLWAGADTAFQGAEDKYKVDKLPRNFWQYQFAFFGDNHIPFDVMKGRTKVVNCGSLMRRNVTQSNYKPAVYVLFSDRTIKKEYIDTKDVISDHREKSTPAGWEKVDTESLANVFRELGQDKSCGDLRDAIDAALLNSPTVSKKVKKVIRNLLDKYSK